MTIMHASHHTDVSTVDYSSLHTQQKLHHCVTDVRRQYPIAPLFGGDLAHAQTVCTRLSLCDPQNVSGSESGNEASVCVCMCVCVCVCVCVCACWSSKL